MSDFEFVEEENLIATMGHWVDTMSGELPETMLPIFSAVGGDGKRESVQQAIPAEMVDRISTACNHCHRDIYIFWLTAINVVLYRYTSNSEFLTGTPYINSGLYYEENENLMFIRGNLSGQLTFDEAIARIRRPVVEAVKYQGFSFDTIYEIMKIKTGVAEPDIFHIAFYYPQIQIHSQRLSRFDLVFSLSQSGDRMKIQYSGKLYERQTICYFAENLLCFIEHALDNPHEDLDHIEIFSQLEMERLNRFNDTYSDFPSKRMFRDVFEQQVDLTPDRIAVMCGNNQLSYRRLNHDANQLAHLLKEQGIGRDSMVALISRRSIKLLTAILGIFKAGGTYVPVDINFPIERTLTYLSQSGASVLLTASSTLMDFETISGQLVSHTNIRTIIYLDRLNSLNKYSTSTSITILDAHTINRYPNKNPPGINLPHDIAYVIFTSGANGLPRGVIIENVGMMNHLHAKFRDLGIDENSIVAQNAAYCMDMSVWQLLAALMGGGKTVIFPDKTVFQPDLFIRQVCMKEITILEVIPTYLSTILDFLESTEPGKQDNFKLHYLLATDEALKFDLTARWFRMFPGITIVNAYGSTETSDGVTHHFMKNSPDKATIPLGKILQNINIYIVSDFMKLCPLGVKGEICVSGTGVGRGYLNDPQKTRTLFMPDPFSTKHKVDKPLARLYKTGDMGRFLPDGTIEFLGRKDFRVKIKGFRIELEEIEQTLNRHPGIKQSVVVEREDLVGNKFLCAYFVPSKVPDIEDFKVFLSNSLPEYMVPGHFINMDHLPLMPDGQVNRRELPSAGRRLDWFADAAHLSDDIEKKLLEIWIGVLGRENISVDDDFFDVGGSSLNGLEVIHKVKKELDVEVPLQEIFQASTIRALAVYINQMKQSGPIEEFSAGSTESGPGYPLTFRQKRIYDLHMQENTGTAFNMPLFFQIEGNFNIKKFQLTINELFQRHEAFRTWFPESEGKPVLRVLSHLQYEPEIQKATEDDLAEIVDNFIKPFDLSQVPLARIRLVRVPRQYILMMDFHNIIFDERSSHIFMSDFLSFYNGEMLPELRIQYKDFSQARQHHFLSEEVHRHEGFWLKQFRGIPPVLELPPDFPGSDEKSFAGEWVQWTPSACQVGKLRHLASDNAATLHTVLMTLLYILMAKYSGLNDISIGTLESGRHHHDQEGIIGLFSNTLVMRNYPSSEKTFLQFLEEVKENAFNTYENRDYSFERLLERLGGTDPEGNDWNRLAQVMLIMERPFNAVLKNESFAITPISYRSNYSPTDLSVYYQDSYKEISFAWQYKSMRYTRQRIEKMCDHFSMILDSAAANPQKPLAEITHRLSL